MRKCIAAVLAGAMLLLSGCSLFFPGTSSSSVSSGAAAEYADEYENGWCYQRLDDHLQQGYAEVYAAVRTSIDREETVTIKDTANGTTKDYNGLKIALSKPLSSRMEAQKLYNAFLTDNPQFFFIGSTYSYEGYRSGNIDYYDTFCLVFTMSAQERVTASRQLDAAVRSILRKVTADASHNQFQTELVLHDSLLSFCSYESRATELSDPLEVYPNAFTAFGALVEGRAVCEGYSRAMQLLLHKASIDCTLVSGKDENGVSHMWNFVTVDGLNYHLDPTWNDSADSLHHSYFNLTTEEILRTHTIDGDNIGIDTCMSETGNYYRRMGLFLNTSSRNEIAAVIAKCVKMGYTTIDLRFSPETFAGARLFINNRTLLSQKVDDALKGTGLSMWNYEEYNVNDSYHTLTLYRSETNDTTAVA